VKNCTVWQAIDDNMAHEYCMLNKKAYEHTHSEYVILITFILQQHLRT